MNNYRNNLTFEQSLTVSGSDYKSPIRIEILDGGNGVNVASVLETFELYGCYLESANYNTLAMQQMIP